MGNKKENGQRSAKEKRREKKYASEREERRAWEERQDAAKRAQGLEPVPYTYVMLVHSDTPCDGEKILFPEAKRGEHSDIMNWLERHPEICQKCETPYRASLLTYTTVYEAAKPTN